MLKLQSTSTDRESGHHHTYPVKGLIFRWEYENAMLYMALRHLSKHSKVTIDAEFLHTWDEENLLWDTSMQHLDLFMVVSLRHKRSIHKIHLISMLFMLWTWLHFLFLMKRVANAIFLMRLGIAYSKEKPLLMSQWTWLECWPVMMATQPGFTYIQWHFFVTWAISSSWVGHLF